MAIGEDGVGDVSSERSMQTPSAPEMEAATTTSVASNSSGGFASSVIPGVRRASSKLQLKMTFKPLSSPKRTDKNEPSRFMGEGVSFKAKLIGILEVAEARGDRMCQDALADLKMAIRAAGEHKQRITINIAIDGLRLRDEKTGDCLYHHLVHKISFIAQDMTDPRAFGYIFGSPDTGHRFFGIKTDKAASQVVECIRDLFQVVFALKNREQHIEQHHLKICGGSNASLMSSNTTPSVTYMEAMQHHLNKESVRENGSPGAAAASSSKAESEATIADLLDLEYELNNLQSNMHHMSHHLEAQHVEQLMSAGSKDEDVFGADPFGDSFTATESSRSGRASAGAAASSAAPVAALPPPPSAKDSVKPDGTGTHRRERASTRAASTTSAGASSTTSSHYAAMPAPLAQEEKHWFDQETEALFDDAELTQTIPNTSSSRLDQDASRVSPLELLSRQATLTDQFDVFTELDPLGTGRSKPYVDKKDFFSDLKNPPKKVLKDLVDPLSVITASTGTTTTSASTTTPLFQASFDKGSRDLAGSQPGALGDVLSALESAPGSSTSFPAFPDPFSDDPFDKTDPFAEGSFSQTVSFSPNTVMPDPFETGFADFSSFPPRNSTSPLQTGSASAGSSAAPHGHGHGPLRVSLPPEEGAASASCLSPSPPLSGSKPRNRLGRKQLSVSLVKIPSPKSSQRRSRLSKQVTVDGSTTARFPPLGSSPTPPLDDCSSTGSQQRRSPGGLSRGVITPSPPIVASFPDLDGDAGSRLSGSSAELAEIAPEPPPRPAPNNAFSIKPPPLPPKKHTGAIYKPPPRPPHQDDSIYDHIENYESSSSPTPHELADAKSPPIPVPARKPRYGDDSSLRHKKQSVLAETEDGYLAPIPFLPPPVKRHQSGHAARKAGQQAPPPAQAAPGKKSLDITLSQLTKTGFSDLATTLGISPSQLSKMTLQDLTKRLASLSEPPQDAFTAGNRSSLSKAEYSALRESVDEDSGFAAEFDDNFCNPGSAAASSSAAAESLFDKYAVFRELLLLQDDKAPPRADEPQNDLSAAKEDAREEDEDEDDAQDAPLAGLPGAASAVPHSSPITIHVAQPDSASASPSPAQAMSDTPLDRYAALREIALGDESSTKEDDEDPRDEDNHAYAEVDNESDKDDSMTEVIHEAMAVQDEDQDLLTLSAQHSESTESPTLDTNTVRDAPSIMETTILEEDAPSEGDGEQASGQPRTSLLDASIVSLEPVPENLELSSKSLLPSLVNGAVACEHSAPAAPVSAMAAKTPAADQAASSRPLSLEAKAAAEPWAKFDSSQFEKPVSDEGASPWSSDGKEFIKGSVSGWKDDSDHERRGRDKGRRRRPNRGPGPPGPPAGSAAWAEDDESEEGWDDRVSDDPWENGFDESQGRPGGRYPEPRRSRRRKVSPWRRGAGSSSGKQSSREVSPWESGESTGPPPGPPGDDMKRGWKSRPKNRESSWEEDRAPRVPGSAGSGGAGSGRGSWDGDGSEYEDARKRRQSPWGEDRDRERRHAWEEGEWYGQAREARDGWDWHYREKERDHRDDEYRRRWEYERGRDRDRDRDWEWDRYGRPRKPGPGSHYRDQSWDDELSEQGDDDRGPRGPHGPHGPPGRKWRRSRPGSAASRGHERVSPSTSIEYKEDDSPGPCPPTSATAPRRRGYHDRDWERDRDRDRERDRMGGSMDRRSRSRDDPFSSDQEHECWERGERTRSRTERGDPRYDQRSQTLYARRANRARYKTYDQSFGAKQSPFEDDFSSQRFDFVTEPKQGSSSFSQESSLDASEPNRSPLPASVHAAHAAHPAHAAAPGLRPQSGSRLRDSLSESEEARAAEGGLGASLSPLERGGSGRGRASSIGSSRRQSPFEDDFTPPNSAGARHLSSASSDISDQHRFDDAPPMAPVAGLGSRAGSGRARTTPVSEARDPDARSNGRSMDDVFLPADVGRAHPGHADALLADAAAEPVISPNRPAAVSAEHRRSVRISGEDKNLAGMKARLANLRRTDSSSSLRKSESINIFARSCDPFDDDDFFAEDGSVATAPGGRAEHPGHQGHQGHQGHPGHPPRPAGDQYKWTEAFDSFNFEEEH